MRTKNLRLFLLLMVVLIPGMAFPAAKASDTADTPGREIPLKEAIEGGFHLDAPYQNRQLDIKIASLAEQKARMKRLFSVDFNGSYLYKSQQMEITFPGSSPAPGVSVPGSALKAGAKHNYDLKLSLLQPIFTGNILANSVKMESQKQFREEYNASVRKIEVTGMIKSSYFTYRLLESKKKSLSLLLERLQLHLKRISDLYQEELVKKSDLLETEIKIGETQINLEDLNRLLAEEKINFTKLCGFAVDQVEKNYLESTGTFEESMSFFLSRHPALKVIEQNAKLLDLQKKIVSGSYLPQVNGFAELHYGKPGIDFFKNQWSLYFQGGIALNLRVFDWQQLKREKQVVDFSAAQLQNQKESFVSEVRKNLAQLYVKKESLAKQLETARQLEKLAGEDAGLKEESVKEQQVANIDFLSALLDKERYESMQNELALQVQLVNLNINALIGRYGEEK